MRGSVRPAHVVAVFILGIIPVRAEQNPRRRVVAANSALTTEANEHSTTRDELHRTQTELITTARQAGMAEVATGVLHNMGNALNTISVSAQLIRASSRTGTTRQRHRGPIRGRHARVDPLRRHTSRRGLPAHPPPHSRLCHRHHAPKLSARSGGTHPVVPRLTA